ncbi:PTS sugar transporter subunit IIA [Romboutsia lituseburensis]|uniref:PTS system IIA component, Glc family n=1 Tax=Romboutsia lituseburensis DSM 797 TaxID=1121325 RepID=A0A1G9KNF9_9FIRM|nr:PTS glucose transporter subunit IIA [Romboutsia lituseburensis]CEH34975.1 Glucose-specific phosphotransferase enzyme IIA component [Romboutsia lituseburensis]SDL51044.1 PTS system IIA component, Glc family [Romboutsia lituseburensis DSM 797]
MGIFDMFKKKKQEEKGIIALTNGELLEITEVPDEVFSNKIMGDGFAIKSNDGIIVSPVDGTVEMVFDTKHAVGLKADNGLEILIHLGVDTVNLKGEGFEVFVNAGDKVSAGDKLIKMDVDFIQKNAKSDISPIIFTNLEENQSVKVITGKVVAKEENRIEILK